MSSNAPSFAMDIRPMFRNDDREAMIDWFDLWAVEDVRRECGTILERLEDETMPCDAPWASEQIATFRNWISAGCPD